MKRLIYSIVLFICCSLTACQTKNDFKGLRPDVKLQEQLDAYSEQLSAAENGWIAYLFPKSGGGYTFKMKFNTENRVNMYADLNANTASTAMESSYRLKATQVPSLFFDTYTYMHLLSDPNPQVAGGIAGKGRYADFEFSILKVSQDSIQLKGNLNGSELLLVRATAQQGDEFIQQVYHYNQQHLSKFDQFNYYYNKVSFGGHSFQFTLNRQLHTVSFRGIGAQDSIRFISEFAVTANGIQLKTPFQIGPSSYQTLTNFNLNTPLGAGTFLIGTENAELKNQAAPLSRYPMDATHMYIAKYQYYSPTGFFYKGVEDVLHLQDIKGYAGLQFIPRRYIDGTDVFYLLYNNGQNYFGPGFKTQIDAQGVMRFTNLLGYDANNASTVTDELYNKVQQMTQQILRPEGFYVYRTATTGYDLVSVADSQLWIRFN
ncbi:DUF4302 domain-containing protein [Sphingobacterium humi]|uniref:DUF4302 domain-containing protein n=1 Tax=Sphingobacterium humi TaxID=1796905 RepID=A0A6N8L0Q7_9SPHI|nr:DUF4302 domain-containing protein [Sphingobacterium humi]MVZ62589.1 DUF4302 domain-containing protein [Sphingobacterium humi]